jgi:hypothetical protein
MLKNFTPSPTARSFYNAWLNAVNHQDLRKDVIDFWPNFAAFTSLVIHRQDGIITQIANELNLKAWNGDYYHIDAVLYKEEDKVHGCPDNATYLHHLRVAFEHENNFNDNLYQEISHLLIANSDLRVLVTYPNIYPLDASLAWFHEMIDHHPCQKQFSDQENFLLIFGYRDGPRWEGRVYKTHGWKELS